MDYIIKKERHTDLIQWHITVDAAVHAFCFFVQVQNSEAEFNTLNSADRKVSKIIFHAHWPFYKWVL